MVEAVKMKYNFFEIDRHGDLKKTSQDLKKKPETKKNFFTDNVNINVGYSIVTPILIGVIIGLTLDSRFHSKPVFTVFFIFLGTVLSFYNLFKLIK
ncbi:MAG: hypothetical protein UR54_C0027G0001 [Candidatus Roizmanbacteria bacterium GW2011_GWA2_34_18]|uniref:AtpZ/AtpI family protein n=1 Tax=Candidatus Roizmanbacteria bacterium GW2011_GWA2_34_18 TaxID=1618477 RepID=A0A0G0ARF0_9BACT|nr:MAG: hypothetical protein UR54_C0027G0001 [Candidatus Roizmanbacteria bacterium GW2011_GWA2_34_18]